MCILRRILNDLLSICVFSIKPLTSCLSPSLFFSLPSGSLAFPTTTLMWLTLAEVVVSGYWVKHGVSLSFGTFSLLSRTTSSPAPQWNPRHKPHPLNLRLHPKTHPPLNCHRITQDQLVGLYMESFFN